MSTDPTRIDIEFNPLARRMIGTTGHGNIPFNIPFISEIAPNLWQGGCQDGLVLPSFIQHLVSLYPWDAYTVEHELSSALEIRMYDSIDQSTEQVDALAAWVNSCRKDGPTLVHCQAGLNRSSLVSARALMFEGMEGAEAIKTLREKRSPACLCNPSFERWIRQGGS